MNQLKEIDVRNFKRIRKAHLALEGHTFIISGENGTGKSSFLDAIAALFGGKDKAPAVPVRKGAKESTIIGRLQTKAGLALKATVTFTATGTRRLVVEDENGKAMSAPQAILDAFWSETSFDPSLFLAAESKDQVVMLKKLLGLDFTKLDKEKDEKYAERTIVNRDLDRVKALAVSLPQFPDAPTEEVSSADVLKEIEAAHTHNQSYQTATALVSAKEETLRSHESNLCDLIDEVNDLKDKLKTANLALNSSAASVENAKRQLEEAKAKALAIVQIDVGPIKAKLSEVEGTNRKVRANLQHADATKAVKEKVAAADKLTERLEEIDAAKEEMLQKAPFPIPGMSINESGVILDGLPLEQASDSQKIAIGVEMAAILNPEKPLMLVRHGALFTPHNLKIMDEIAEKRGLTCIVEIPSEKPLGNSSLHFVDGVADSETSPETPAQLPLT